MDRISHPPVAADILELNIRFLNWIWFMLAMSLLSFRFVEIGDACWSCRWIAATRKLMTKLLKTFIPAPTLTILSKSSQKG